VFSR
jgi:hypothetical protein